MLPHTPTRAGPAPGIGTNCPFSKSGGGGEGDAGMSQERDLLLQRFQNIPLAQQTPGLVVRVQLATKKFGGWGLSLSPRPSHAGFVAARPWYYLGAPSFSLAVKCT